MNLRDLPKSLVKQYVLPRLSTEQCEAMVGLAVAAEFRQARSGEATFATREELWDSVLHTLKERPILYIEFGVFEGYSIRHFAAANLHPESRFLGLDSFAGLPENWGDSPQGTFSTGGAIPQIADQRVEFMKGWFQETGDAMLRRIGATGDRALVVHYDADLYSSTLYALSLLDRLKTPYYAFFDEFDVHEVRALHNYLQAFTAGATFLGATGGGIRGLQVLCRITPKPVFLSADPIGSRSGAEQAVAKLPRT